MPRGPGGKKGGKSKAAVAISDGEGDWEDVQDEEEESVGNAAKEDGRKKNKGKAHRMRYQLGFKLTVLDQVAALTARGGRKVSHPSSSRGDKT